MQRPSELSNKRVFSQFRVVVKEFFFLYKPPACGAHKQGRTMNFKLLFVAVAICLMLASGTEGYRRKHAGYERKVFREMGAAAEEGLEELAESLEKDLEAFGNWLASLRRRR